MLLMIDNYDSFTFNLIRYCEELQLETLVRKNDEIDLDSIRQLKPSAILLSPGPGNPQQAGICLDVVRTFAGIIPIFGICLGHQIICEAFGGRIVRAKEVVHGRTSKVFHTDTGLFAGLPQSFNVTRYHSLVAELESLPQSLQITCWTLDHDRCFDEIMAVQHKEFEVYGVQFHPEALLSDYGREILASFFQAQKIQIAANTIECQERSDI